VRTLKAVNWGGSLMFVRMRTLALLLILSCVAVAALVGAGGSAASSTTQCSVPAPNGRLVCVSVEDSDGVSPSGLVGSGNRQANVLAYQFYKLTVSNNGGSTLTNGTMTVDLTDTVPSGSVVSTAAFTPSGSSPACSATSTSPNRVTCSLGNLPANASTPLLVLGYRTSTSLGVTATTAAITTSFKEGGNPNGANPSTFSITETTSLEPDPEASVAWSPPGQQVAMATSPTFDAQFSSLDYKVPAGKSPFVATMNEGPRSFCGTGLSCFGEQVTTHLPAPDVDTFTATNLFHLQITISLDAVPGGNTSGVVLVHRLDDNTVEIVSTKCSSSPPSPTDALPCLTVTKDNKAKLLVIDAWGFKNGGWVPGV
jgi:hypothetical protein